MKWVGQEELVTQVLDAWLGKKIIYLPIGIFSPVTLKKIRMFHVLDGYHVRQYARSFIPSQG